MQIEKNKYRSLPANTVEEKSQRYGFVSMSEEEKLKEDIFRPDIEKLQLFTSMLRRNISLKKAIITHSK